MIINFMDEKKKREAKKAFVVLGKTAYNKNSFELVKFTLPKVPLTFFQKSDIDFSESDAFYSKN